VGHVSAYPQVDERALPVLRLGPGAHRAVGVCPLHVTEQGESTLDVPAGTPSGKVMRLRGKGLPELRGGRGDLLVHLHVVVPGRLGAAERKLLEELGRLDSFKAPRPSRSLFDRMRDALAG